MSIEKKKKNSLCGTTPHHTTTIKLFITGSIIKATTKIHNKPFGNYRSQFCVPQSHQRALTQGVWWDPLGRDSAICASLIWVLWVAFLWPSIAMMAFPSAPQPTMFLKPISLVCVCFTQIMHSKTSWTRFLWEKALMFNNDWKQTQP